MKNTSKWILTPYLWYYKNKRQHAVQKKILVAKKQDSEQNGMKSEQTALLACRGIQTVEKQTDVLTGVLQRMLTS